MTLFITLCVIFWLFGFVANLGLIYYSKGWIDPFDCCTCLILWPFLDAALVISALALLIYWATKKLSKDDD